MWAIFCLDVLSRPGYGRISVYSSKFVLNRAFFHKPLGNLPVRAICWALWAERNSHILSCLAFNFPMIICKIDWLLLSWFFASLGPVHAYLEPSIPLIKCSLSFVKSLLATRVPLMPSGVALRNHTFSGIIPWFNLFRAPSPGLGFSWVLCVWLLFCCCSMYATFLPFCYSFSFYFWCGCGGSPCLCCFSIV